MTNEEPKITFESILQNWNAQYNPITKAQTRQPVKALELSATMRNPETPAGTYPAFEAYLGVDVVEKKRQLKQEKRRKRKEIRGKIFGFLKVVIPILLVGAQSSAVSCSSSPAPHRTLAMVIFKTSLRRQKPLQ